MIDAVAFLAALISSQTASSPSPLETHPLFAALTPERMKSEYTRGRQDAKRKVGLDGRVDAYRKDLGKVRSPNGWDWPASCASIMTEPFVWWYAGFNDERTYRDTKEFDSAVTWAESNPDQWKERTKSFGMVVCLRAWPGVAANHEGLTYSAKESDVRDVQFVLLVDGDPSRALHPVIPPEMESASSDRGTISSTRTNIATVKTQSSGSAYAYGSNGVSAWGSSSGTSTSTVTYNTTEIEGYRAYSANWSLSFPLYDDKGNPTVPTTTKTLVLKVIRKNGELSTTFKLSDYKR